MSGEQFITSKEMGEIHRLMRCLDGLKEISPNPIALYDANGKLLGRLAWAEGVWSLRYPEPQEPPE